MATVKIPSILAFERKISPSDGRLFGAIWEKRHENLMPLKLQEKSVRGTISHRLTDVSKAEKEMANKESANLQTVDSCMLPLAMDTLCISYTVKFLSGVEIPSACNESEYQEKYENLVKGYIEKYGFDELASRYAQNIASGRTLWRNRFGAKDIETVVTFEDGTEMIFDASSFSTKHFNKIEDVKVFSDKISNALSGKAPYLFVRVKTFARLGEGQEVFPSEELVFNLSKENKKSKFLYETEGYAALHSQKIGNAIRTVDTWYPNVSALGIGPIAAEVYGSVTTRGKAYRSEKGTDFYSLFDGAVEEGEFRSANDAHYVMAVLIRGGVFGKSGKKDAKEE